ncbi:MAG: hypothetical protein MOB07_06320 [Acidobacteria bacterium]|nr:hypothetical protein [Acidobacteriota bacterium]
MAVPDSTNYVFLPWVRQGAASGIQTPDSLSANQAGVVLVTVRLRVNNADDIDRQVRLYGPGDITGIDPQQVVRTEPRHLTTDFEPNYFPAIEFDRPDFPWLFTPAMADITGRLRPWLCLVVVRKQEGVILRTDRNLPLPVLEIMKPAAPERELPDLSESWAWAHAQVTGSRREAGSLKASLAGDPALTVSRLLCPRRLDPATEYLACVVPAFELGCKAGLGMPIEPAAEQPPLGLAPAWASGAQSPSEVRLPVYFHWEFRTGTGGDFEELVRLLEPRKMSKEVGKRRMDISHPGFQIIPPLPPGTILELEGALRVLDAETADWPQETRTRFQAELKKILDAPWQAMKEEGEEGKSPLLAPPIYGCWQAARHTVNITPVPPAALIWLDELNLDPRHRAVAALGTKVVQTQQEQLMASAWEQLGEIERINQMRRQAQLARAVNAVYYAKHFSRFSDETLLKVVASAQSRIVVEATDQNNVKARALLSHRISQSAIPDRAVSAPLRRLTSPRGTISTRFQPIGAPPIAIVVKLNTLTPIVMFQKKEAGLVTINQVADQAGGFAAPLKETLRFERITNALDTAPQLGDFKIVPEGSVRSLLDFKPQMPDSPDARAFRDAAKAHQDYLIQQAFISFKIFPAPPMKLSETKNALLLSINPEMTIKTRVKFSLRIADGAGQTGDPLEPILDAPEFPQPMYEALRDLSQEFLFPGLERVLPNTVTLLKTNPEFVESYLVGLNAEMSSELLWRNYPTDQRGTFFRQFWDNDQPDIEVIKKWGNRKLGDNARVGEKLVLLIRGELLRRYPNSVIYAVAAVRKDGQLDLSRKPEDERQPLFRGTLKPDVTFLGFDLKREDVIADPGWFFVIQQQPTEPCFGMDVANFDKPLPPLTTWNDLSWRHLVSTEDELKALSHASIKTALPDIEKAKWGRNSAHQAYITMQRPVRIAIHAREMITLG